MDKDSLLSELSYINAARVHRMRVAKLILESKNNFKPLLEIVFSEQQPKVVKAAWVLEFVVHQKLDWLLENIDYFTATIGSLKNGSAVRPIAKICEIFALFLDKNPSKKPTFHKNIQQIIEVGFDWMLSDHKIAIKAYTMQTLYLFGKDDDWIYPELKVILESNLHKESIGYRNRALKILKRIS
ncbi:MAG TPA: adenylosuccinate lyase [Flavobacteriia bacterium]|nr:adenylosuccinate lyase [Flavobacteriia bacterium]